MDLNNATLAKANLEAPLAVIPTANSSHPNLSADPSQQLVKLKPVASWISPLPRSSAELPLTERQASFARPQPSPEFAMDTEPALRSPKQIILPKKQIKESQIIKKTNFF